MKRFVEDTFYITAKEAAKVLPKDAETGCASLEIAGSYIQEIVIISTASNLEGFVRWFICPACGNRVGKLYLPTNEAVFLCRKCHNLAYRAQQLRAFKKPEKARDKTPKKGYTKEDWLREARAFLEKMGEEKKGSFRRILRLIERKGGHRIEHTLNWD